ncbi:Insect cuticle protein [Trinorchestia longiramus]|nr:Insect cuticle protein [Trinorchestia longiramus]
MPSRTNQQSAERLTTGVLLLLLMAGFGDTKPMDREHINPLQLSTFKGYHYDYSLGKNGVYKFFYSLPTSSRQEQRDENGEVRGSYSFVAPEGDEFDFKYEAGRKGFQVESKALPTRPQDTEEVRKAKQEFFEAYQKALELVSSSESEGNNHGKEELDGDKEESTEDDEDEESSEESDEDDDDDNEESSEESDEDDDDEESDEDDDEESDEDDDGETKQEKEDKDNGGEVDKRVNEKDGRQGTGNAIKNPRKGRGRITKVVSKVTTGSKVFGARKLKKPGFPNTVAGKKLGSKKRRVSTATFKRPIFISSLPPKRKTARQSLGGYGEKVQARKPYYYA